MFNLIKLVQINQNLILVTGWNAITTFTTFHQSLVILQRELSTMKS